MLSVTYEPFMSIAIMLSVIIMSVTAPKNKLECPIMQGWEGLLATNTLALWSHTRVKKNLKCCKHSPRFLNK
jgi:hypothetical protein